MTVRMPASLRSLVVSHRDGWWELVKFSVVGGSGFVVNLAVYALAYGVLALHYLVAGVLAFFVATVNNYLINRYWTFPRGGGPTLGEYGRFLLIGIAALAGNLVLLAFFVERLRVAELPSQAAAIVLVTPVSFVGNKVWTFRARE
jgi:putative flippase GtrA